MHVPKISIIMPAYNAEDYISSAIESVRSQIFTNWELIIVDDGSTDSTASIVKRCKNYDHRIKYYYQKNKKQAAARNLGISYSEGEWISFLDADDLWLPTKLEIQNNYIETVEADIFFTAGYVIDEEGNIISDYTSIYGKFLGQEMYKKLYEFNVIPIVSVILKRELVIIVGQQDEGQYVLQWCEDWDYWIRLSKVGAVFFGINEKLFMYRINPYGTSRDTIKMHLGQALIFIKNFDKGIFTNLEIRKIFKPLIAPLLFALIKNNKLIEANILLKNLSLKVPITSYKLSYLIFKPLKKFSIIPLKVINKIDNLIKGHC